MAPSKKHQYDNNSVNSSRPWNGDRDVRDFDSAEIAERRGLLLPKQQGGSSTSRVRQRHDQRLRALLDTSTLLQQRRQDDWMRPYWLGGALFLVLFPFWLLDSLKDPVFGALILQGNLQDNLPTAKLFSVCTTLVLVCCLEYLAQERQRRRDAKRAAQQQQRGHDDCSENDVLDGGGRWKRMGIVTSTEPQYWDEEDDEDELGSQDRVPISIFASIGVPYCLFFGLVAYLLQFNPATALVPGGPAHVTLNNRYKNVWHVLGYFVYAAIESYGSLAVATFWSYTNSTLSLDDAEAFYGTIIAMAQCGAIVGSTMVTMHVWSSITLFITACLLILLHILVMMAYARRFPPTSNVAAGENEPTVLEGIDETAASTHGDATATSSGGMNNGSKTSLWSGIHLILKHNYVLLILGVSCLYEVSLTCLNYQMTLLGWSRFEETPSYDPDNSTIKSMSFTQFMGHYGQMVNIFSLILSSFLFPQFIRRLGLKYTLRIFPTLLLFVNAVAFGALPGNLTVLFFSMSILKAMTYSIHDPSKEILYIPTSNAIKFKSKFWIDVVGARFAKAIGSSINAHAGSVDRSIRVASAPSLVTAAGLWYVCFRVGRQFEHLVKHQYVVGRDDDNDPLRWNQHDFSAEHDEDGDGRGEVQESTDSMELTAL